MRLSLALYSSSPASRGAFLVTGGGSGLGEAVSRRLRKDGFDVVICDLNKDSSALASEIGASFAHCDVADEKNVASAVALAVEKHGKVAGAVNCA